jgi:hypothetical protein
LTYVRNGGFPLHLATMTLPFKTKRAETATSFAAIIVGLLALAPLARGAKPEDPGGIKTCEQQEPCLKWEVLKLAGESCLIGADLCPIKVCLVLDTGDPECSKGASGTVSHLCDNANSQGCVRPEPWFQHTGGVDNDRDGAGNCDPSEIVSGWEDKCDTVATGVRLCQIGKPNDVLFWIV